MREEVLGFLAVRPDGCYLDATTGMGGHTEAIARCLTTGRVIACDRDGETLEMARRNLAPWGEKIVFRKALFSELENVLLNLGIRQVDGLVADLGPNYQQLTSQDRGFSVHAASAPLDMRMDRTQELTAADLVNHLSEKDLADLFYRLAGERSARRVARAITRARPIRTMGELVRLIESVAPWRKSRLHPATRVAMALRIAVNREMEELDALLEALPRLVAPGGRAVVIAFHSGEDTKVKHRLQEMARRGNFRLLTKHVVRPRLEEVRENPPSRSARLRAVERIHAGTRNEHGNMGNVD